MANDSYFGIELGKALSSGAGSISSALQRKYEIQNQLQQQRLQNQRQDFQTQAQAAQMGVAYDPNNPAASFEPYRQTVQRQQEMGLRKSEADIGYREAAAGLFSAKAKMQPKNKPTVAQSAVDRAFGKEYSDYVASGGFADTFMQLDALKEVQKTLASGKGNLTGPIVGMIPDAIRSRTNPKSMAAQQQVEQTVQRSLKKTLGGQFTEREGVMFMQRGYDPRLPEKENAKKLARTISQLENMAKAKQEAINYYERNGTLVGYKGKLYSMQDGEVKEIGIPQMEPMISGQESGLPDITPEEQAEFDRMIEQGY